MPNEPRLLFTDCLRRPENNFSFQPNFTAHRRGGIQGLRLHDGRHAIDLR